MLSVDTIYIQLFSDRFIVKNVDSGESKETKRDMTHASPRMLVADFTMTQHQLKEIVKSVRRGIRAPQILMHPMECIEGGVTQVEFRVFVELGMSCGASKTAVYSGPPLAGESIKTAVRDYSH